MERVTEPGLKTSRLRDNGYRIVFAVMVTVLIAAYNMHTRVLMALDITTEKRDR